MKFQIMWRQSQRWHLTLVLCPTTKERDRFNYIGELGLDVYKNKINPHYFPKNEAFYDKFKLADNFSGTTNDNSAEDVNKIWSFISFEILFNMYLTVKRMPFRISGNTSDTMEK